MAKSNQAIWEEEQRVRSCVAERSAAVYTAERVRMDERGDRCRLLTRMHAERREAAAEEALVRMKEAQRCTADRLAQETALAEEVRRMRDKEIVEQKERQRLRESSSELRELEAKLRAAYSLKELDAQLRERRLATVREENEKMLTNDLLQQSWQRREREEREAERAEEERKRQYRGELQGQMVYAESRRHSLFEEFLLEKRLLDEALRRIQEEDLRAEMQRVEKMQRTKREMDDFAAAQAVWRRREKLALEEENERIAEYLRQQGHKRETGLEESRLRSEARALLSERVAGEIHRAWREKMENEDVLRQLDEEETAAREERRRLADVERTLRIRADLRQGWRVQVQERREKLEREAALEDESRREMLEKMAEEARVETLTREAQRRKKLEFQREVEYVLEERRVQRAEEMQRLINLERLQKDREKSHLQRVETERLAMLREHATKLLGYLPSGLLRETDLPLLGPEFVQLYGSKTLQTNTQLAS